MVFRRRAYSLRRKRPYRKRRMIKKMRKAKVARRSYYANGKAWTGQTSVAMQLRTDLIMDASTNKAAAALGWGNDGSILGSGWPLGSHIGFAACPEWRGYSALFQEYQITGVKFQVAPLTAVGSPPDLRYMG